MGHLLAHCSDISLFHALVIMSKDLFSKLFLRFYWAFAMYKSCDEHSVRNMHFTNYPRQMYLITSWGKKKILFLLELFYWTKVLLSVKKFFCVLLFEKISYFRTLNFSFKPAFHILEEMPNGHPRAWNIPFKFNVYKSCTGLHNHMTQTWALLSLRGAYSETEMYDYFLEVFWMSVVEYLWYLNTSLLRIYSAC